MRRASAELAERRRASFGSRGKNANIAQTVRRLLTEISFPSRFTCRRYFRSTSCCDSIPGFTWGKFDVVLKRFVGEEE